MLSLLLCSRVLYSLEEKYHIDPRQEPSLYKIVFVYLLVAILGTFFSSFCEVREPGALEDSHSECPSHTVEAKEASFSVG